MKQRQAKLLFHFLGLVFGIIILFILVRLIGIREFLDLLKQLSYLTIAGAVVVYAASWYFRTWRLGVMTKAMGGQIRFFDLFKLHISGYALNVVLPGKLGDVATVGYLEVVRHERHPGGRPHPADPDTGLVRHQHAAGCCSGSASPPGRPRPGSGSSS